MVGYCNGQDNSLSAFGKGEKGKGGDYVKRPLDCHNCGGLGHPSRLCTSAQWAKGSGGAICSNCKGVGHDKPNYPSPGGAKHVPPQARDPKGKGKGKDGKGKGKGKGKSNYFSGKGSGLVSLLDYEGYSEAD